MKPHSGNGRPQYRGGIVGQVAQAIREHHRQAVLEGRGAEFARAMREIGRRLNLMS
jgi:hypothetical protein